MTASKTDPPPAREGLVIAAVLVAAVLLGALLTSTEQPAYPYDRSVSTLVVLVGALAIGFCWARSVGGTHRASLVVALAGTVSFLAFAVPFRHTPYGLNGLAGDAWFTTAMVTKAAHGEWFGDYTYLELSAFYPPLYHQLLGLVAKLSGVEPARAIKPGFLAVALVLPIVVYRAWRSLVPTTVAVVVAVLFALSEPRDLAYKPFEVLSAALIVPWWLYYVEGIGVADRRRRFVLWGGLAGAALFLLYYYWFFVLGAWWFVRTAYRLGRERKLDAGLRAPLSILGVAALGSALFWGPIMLDLARYGLDPLQSHWLRPHMLALPIRGGLSIASLVTYSGLIYVVATARSDRLARGVAHVAAAVLLWYALGLLGLSFETPLLHHKTRALLSYAGIAGFGLLLHRGVQRLGEREHLVAGAALALGVFAYGDGVLRVPEHGSYETAIKAGKKAPEDRYAKLRKLDVDGKVFLTTDADVVALVPVHTFIGHNAHFAHPASRFRERLAFLQSLDWVRDGEALCWLLSHNRFSAIDYVYAKHGKLVLQDDAFPAEQPATRVEIQLKERAFDHACFEPVGGGILAVRAPDLALAETFSGRLRDLAVEYGSEEAAAIASSAQGPGRPDAYSLESGDLAMHDCVEPKKKQARGRKCPSGIVLYGPYAPAPKQANIRARFTVRAGEESIEAAIDIASGKGKRIHGVSSRLEIPAGEQVQLMHQTTLPTAVEDVEARLIVNSKSNATDFRVLEAVVEVFPPPR